MATPTGDATPLGVGVPLSEENAAQSTLVELTSLEVESYSPEGSMDGADTLSSASSPARVGRRCSMATVISGPETNGKRVRSWRWSVEPEQ